MQKRSDRSGYAPHLWQRRMYQTVTDSFGDQRPIVGSPWHFSRAVTSITQGAPNLGQHNSYVYCDLLGLPKQADRNLGEPFHNAMTFASGMYWQDDWKISPHLTPEVRGVLNVPGALASRSGRGGTAPSAVAVQLAEVRADLAAQQEWAAAKRK